MSQLHTPAGRVSSSAVLYPWSWLSLQRSCSWLWDHCPSLPGEGGVGQKGDSRSQLSRWNRKEEGLSVRSTKCSLLPLPNRSHFPASPQPPSTALHRWVSHGWRMSKPNADCGSWFSARDLYCLCLSSALRAVLCVWLEFCDFVSSRYPSCLHGPEVAKKKKC